MLNGIHILGSKMLGAQKQLTTIADNVANVNTTGFKKLTYDFEEVSARKQGQHVGDYSKGIGVLVDHSAGQINHTGNKLDVAILGDAFFGTTDANGQTVYTRNGHFSVDNTGRLVTAQGNPVLDPSGGEINIPATATDVIITREGAIATEDGLLTNIGLYTFDPKDKQALNRAGSAGYIAPDGVSPKPAGSDVIVAQGSLESSNVVAITEVVRLQEMSRAYQSAAKSIKALEDLEERAVRSLAVTPN